VTGNMRLLGSSDGRSWVLSAGSAQPRRGVDPFAMFDMPDEWEGQVWATAGVKALLDLGPRTLRSRPQQAGCVIDAVRNARRPSHEQLQGSPDKPTCQVPVCNVVVPNDDFGQVDKKVRKEASRSCSVSTTIPDITREATMHSILYERLYWAAKRRLRVASSSKAALYAPVRYHEQPPGAKTPAGEAGLRVDPAGSPSLSRLCHPLRPARRAQVLPARRIAAAIRRDYQSGQVVLVGLPERAN